MKYYLLSDSKFTPEGNGLWTFKRLSIDSDIDDLESKLRERELSILPELVHVTLKHTGNERDFNFSLTSRKTPIVSSKFKAVISKALNKEEKDVLHFIPIKFENHAPEEDYFLMLISSRCDAIDTHRSCFEKFPHNDPSRPNLSGKYSVFTNLIVDPSRCDIKIFKLEDTISHIIINKEIKDAFEVSGVTGVNLEPVNGEQQTVC